jgi:hypothetical protein
MCYTPHLEIAPDSVRRSLIDTGIQTKLKPPNGNALCSICGNRAKVSNMNLSDCSLSTVLARRKRPSFKESESLAGHFGAALSLKRDSQQRGLWDFIGTSDVNETQGRGPKKQNTIVPADSGDLECSFAVFTGRSRDSSLVSIGSLRRSSGMIARVKAEIFTLIVEMDG